ncbi:hypothetical protein GCM10022248_44230 [Nonomuraea soli]
MEAIAMKTITASIQYTRILRATCGRAATSCPPKSACCRTYPTRQLRVRRRIPVTVDAGTAPRNDNHASP